MNHVLYQQPDWDQCPYEDCTAPAQDAYTFEQVREYHPEYPEVPEKGVKYSTLELVDKEYQVYVDALREMVERKENE